jgi:hypothetical protein
VWAPYIKRGSRRERDIFRAGSAIYRVLDYSSRSSRSSSTVPCLSLVVSFPLAPWSGSSAAATSAEISLGLPYINSGFWAGLPILSGTRLRGPRPGEIRRTVTYSARYVYQEHGREQIYTWVFLRSTAPATVGSYHSKRPTVPKWHGMAGSRLLTHDTCARSQPPSSTRFPRS